jgi:hypothetical protein
VAGCWFAAAALAALLVRILGSQYKQKFSRQLPHSCLDKQLNMNDIDGAPASFLKNIGAVAPVTKKNHTATTGATCLIASNDAPPAWALCHHHNSQSSAARHNREHGLHVHTCQATSIVAVHCAPETSAAASTD